MIDTLEFSARRGEEDALAGRPFDPPIIYTEERDEYASAFLSAKIALQYGCSPQLQ